MLKHLGACPTLTSGIPSYGLTESPNREPGSRSRNVFVTYRLQCKPVKMTCYKIRKIS